MDAQSRAVYGTEFVNLSAPEECLKCGSTDLVDTSQPQEERPALPKQVEDLASQLTAAGQKWEEAHALGLKEAQEGVMTHYQSTQVTKREMEEVIQQLIGEARVNGILGDVILFLQRKGEKAALYVMDAYL